jgi:hypothetical protein
VSKKGIHDRSRRNKVLSPGYSSTHFIRGLPGSNLRFRFDEVANPDPQWRFGPTPWPDLNPNLESGSGSNRVHGVRGPDRGQSTHKHEDSFRVDFKVDLKHFYLHNSSAADLIISSGFDLVLINDLTRI